MVYYEFVLILTVSLLRYSILDATPTSSTAAKTCLGDRMYNSFCSKVTTKYCFTNNYDDMLKTATSITTNCVGIGFYFICNDDTNDHL